MEADSQARKPAGMIRQINNRRFPPEVTTTGLHTFSAKDPHTLMSQNTTEEEGFVCAPLAVEYTHFHKSSGICFDSKVLVMLSLKEMLRNVACLVDI